MQADLADPSSASNSAVRQAVAATVLSGAGAVAASDVTVVAASAVFMGAGYSLLLQVQARAWPHLSQGSQCR
jgi:hypothetical protein